MLIVFKVLDQCCKSDQFINDVFSLKAMTTSICDLNQKPSLVKEEFVRKLIPSNSTINRPLRVLRLLAVIPLLSFLGNILALAYSINCTVIV